MPKLLTDDQVEQYRRDGYVSPVRIMSEDDAARYRRELEDFEAAQGGPLHGTQRTKACLLFPFVYEMVTKPALLDAVEDLYGPDILVYQSAAWIKEPETGNFVSWHQDITYFGMDPTDCLSAWIALTPATAETGCMQVIPGSHHRGMLPVDYTDVSPDNLLASGQRVRYEIDESAAVPMELRPGEMSLHHSCLIHSSRPNHGTERRIGFTACCLPTYVRQTTELKASAMLLRGEDRYGHYPLDERPPLAPDDPATVARHARGVELYRGKATECGNSTAWRFG